jgi:hypothetical protein
MAVPRRTPDEHPIGVGHEAACDPETVEMKSNVADQGPQLGDEEAIGHVVCDEVVGAGLKRVELVSCPGGLCEIGVANDRRSAGPQDAHAFGQKLARSDHVGEGIASTLSSSSASAAPSPV